jgi:predicted transcriptional regulator
MPLLMTHQIRAARAALRMEQEQLAAAAGVSINTIKRLEGLDGEIPAKLDTVLKIQRALEAAGVEFWNDDAPGVRLRRRAA